MEELKLGVTPTTMIDDLNQEGYYLPSSKSSMNIGTDNQMDVAAQIAISQNQSASDLQEVSARLLLQKQSYGGQRAALLSRQNVEESIRTGSYALAPGKRPMTQDNNSGHPNNMKKRHAYFDGGHMSNQHFNQAGGLKANDLTQMMLHMTAT